MIFLSRIFVLTLFLLGLQLIRRQKISFVIFTRSFLISVIIILPSGIIIAATKTFSFGKILTETEVAAGMFLAVFFVAMVRGLESMFDDWNAWTMSWSMSLMDSVRKRGIKKTGTPSDENAKDNFSVS